MHTTGTFNILVAGLSEQDVECILITGLALLEKEKKIAQQAGESSLYCSSIMRVCSRSFSCRYGW